MRWSHGCLSSGWNQGLSLEKEGYGEHMRLFEK